MKIHAILQLLIYSALLLTPSLVPAKTPFRTIEGIVTRVSDGDTIAVQDDLGTKSKVRLYGIDTPETERRNQKTGRISKPGQPYGSEAQRILESKVAGKRVRLDVLALDKYKRLVALVRLEDRNINREMVSEGWAWAYRKYLESPYYSEFINIEESAKTRRLGLWKDESPEPPWEFRKRLRIR